MVNDEGGRAPDVAPVDTIYCISPTQHHDLYTRLAKTHTPLGDRYYLQAESRCVRGPQSSALVLRLAAVQRHEENRCQPESVLLAIG